MANACIRLTIPSSLASHTLLAKNKAEGSGDRACNVSFHSPCIGGETYFMCTLDVSSGSKGCRTEST